MIGVLVGLAVFCGVLAVRPPSMTNVLGRYVADADEPRTVHDRSWMAALPSAGVGLAIGSVLVPGGITTGAVVGLAAGFWLGRLHASARRRRRGDRLGLELPTVADMCALHILSGESVVGSIRRFTTEADGVAAEEMTDILDAVERGTGFPEAAREAARCSAHRDAGRLYELLAQAHRSGARLIDSLEMFASDRRAAIERELTAEGGRRALTGYGPILGLMIPTTLLFLMYPTLAGLDALAATR